LYRALLFKTMPNLAEHERWVLSGALREFVVDGEFDLVRTIIDVFLSDTQEKIDSLQEAVRTADLAGARVTAHGLKGAARQMGLPRFAEDAERLERSSPQIDTATFSSFALALVDSWQQAKQSVIETRDSAEIQHPVRDPG
jgi:HPt (histidine-containing phosphotransfer) domain-containing protein